MNICLNEFYNAGTLNIFCDASTIKYNNMTIGCYAVVAVCGDTIVDAICRPATNSTNNESELKGLRAAISLALSFQYQYNRINIFSDSSISVLGLREYIYKWGYKDGTLYTSENKPVANQHIFVECHRLLSYFADLSKLGIYHQKGHVDNTYVNLVHASETFKRTNNIPGIIDLNLIRYISTYNNFVDNLSRSTLKRNLNKDLVYTDPVYFFANGKINKYQ